MLCIIHKLYFYNITSLSAVLCDRLLTEKFKKNTKKQKTTPGAASLRQRYAEPPRTGPNLRWVPAPASRGDRCNPTVHRRDVVGAGTSGASSAAFQYWSLCEV